MRMRFFTFATAVVVSFMASSCFAEAWVTKMFAETKHDFGTVARGADTVFKFPIKNIYKQDIELLSVRSSCGCTSPTIDKKVLKTGETGYVTAVFNTRTFTGVHGATLTVEVRWNDGGNWRHGEGQLRVDGNIRSDVVFTPGAVGFEGVDQGKATEQKVEVTYRGRSDWKIVDVRGASDALEVELTQKQRYTGYVAYQLLVRLKDTAAAGPLSEQLILVTNDDDTPRIPIYVSGNVVAQISAPESVMLGSVTQGEQVSKKVLVRGRAPFKIMGVQCADEQHFTFTTDEKSSDKHVIEVKFDAKQDLGNVKQPIHISTDLGEKFQATMTAYATVVPNEAAPAQPAPAPPTAKDTNVAKPAVDAGSADATVSPANVARQ